MNPNMNQMAARAHQSELQRHAAAGHRRDQATTATRTTRPSPWARMLDGLHDSAPSLRERPAVVRPSRVGI